MRVDVSVLSRTGQMDAACSCRGVQTKIHRHRFYTNNCDTCHLHSVTDTHQFCKLIMSLELGRHFTQTGFLFLEGRERERGRVQVDLIISVDGVGDQDWSLLVSWCPGTSPPRLHGSIITRRIGVSLHTETEESPALPGPAFSPLVAVPVGETRTGSSDHGS